MRSRAGWSAFVRRFRISSSRESALVRCARPCASRTSRPRFTRRCSESAERRPDAFSSSRCFSSPSSSSRTVAAPSCSSTPRRAAASDRASASLARASSALDASACRSSPFRCCAAAIARSSRDRRRTSACVEDSALLMDALMRASSRPCSSSWSKLSFSRCSDRSLASSSAPAFAQTTPFSCSSRSRASRSSSARRASSPYRTSRASSALRSAWCSSMRACSASTPPQLPRGPATASRPASFDRRAKRRPSISRCRCSRSAACAAVHPPPPRSSARSDPRAASS